MFHHILVPLDFSSKDRAALEAAVAIARRSGLTLVHVIQGVEHIGIDELQAFYDELRNKAEERIQPIAARLAEDQLSVEYELSIGRPAAEILRIAHEHGVDLIILSSHKIDPQRPTEGWGTVSHQVSILAQCPLMLVK